jgi:hypothetical protein
MLETVPMLIFGEQVTESAIIHARRDMEQGLGFRTACNKRSLGSAPQQLRSRSDGQAAIYLTAYLVTANLALPSLMRTPWP